MSEHYVYILYRPDGRPCYVGKGKGNRVQGNIRKSHNTILARIVADAGGIIPFSKVSERLPESWAFELERFLISEIGRAPGGPLVNMTDGGDGVSGHVRSPEYIEKMRARNKGRPVSPESRKKISEKLKGRKFSAEHRAAISAAKKGISRPYTEKQRAAKRAEAERRKGIPRPASFIEKLRAAQASMTREARELKSRRISAALTGKRLTETHRATISAIQNGKVRSHEFREKVRAGMLKYHRMRKASEETGPQLRLLGAANAAIA